MLNLLRRSLAGMLAFTGSGFLGAQAAQATTPPIETVVASAASAAVPNHFSTGFVTIKPGSPALDVRALQYLLDEHGDHSDGVTNYDSTTVAAVKTYQRASALPVTGLADSATLTKLTDQAGTRYGISNSGTLALETLLKKHGYVFGQGAAPAMSMLYGSNVDTFVEAFQTGHGISATSFAGHYTWRTLFAAKTSGPLYALRQAGTGAASGSNCGPTSAISVLLSRNVIPHGWNYNTNSRSVAINYFRYVSAKVPNNTHWNEAGTTYKQIIPGFAANGISSFQGGVQDVMNAAQHGEPSIEGGGSALLPWNKLNGDYSHFIAILGWDGTHYIAMDPLATGIHLLTPAQLSRFATEAPKWGPGIDGNDVAPWHNSIITR